MNNIHLHKFNSKYNGFHDRWVQKAELLGGDKIVSAARIADERVASLLASIPEG